MSEHATTNPGVESNISTATPQPQPSRCDIAGMRLPEPTQTPKSHWDVAQLRLPQDYSAGSQEVVQTAVPVEKPRKETWFRAHPDWHILVATLTHEECLYVVAASLCNTLEGDIRIKLLVPYITRDGDIGIWPLNPHQATGRTDEWTASAHRVLVTARKGWVRMRSNMRLRSYDLIRPKVDWEEPTWPELEFEDLLETTLGDRMISTLDHPVVRALQGEA